MLHPGEKFWYQQIAQEVAFQIKQTPFENSNCTSFFLPTKRKGTSENKVGGTKVHYKPSISGTGGRVSRGVPCLGDSHHLGIKQKCEPLNAFFSPKWLPYSKIDRSHKSPDKELSNELLIASWGQKKTKLRKMEKTNVTIVHKGFARERGGRTHERSMKGQRE